MQFEVKGKEGTCGLSGFVGNAKHPKKWGNIISSNDREDWAKGGAMQARGGGLRLLGGVKQWESGGPPET